jgi:RimJ/RimL family protein N-acetyltransferase
VVCLKCCWFSSGVARAGQHIVGRQRKTSTVRAIEFETRRLRLREWRQSDREPFAAMNADPLVMEFFPAPHSRAWSDASIDAWQAQFRECGWSNWAAELRSTGEFIGFVGLSVPKRVFPFPVC